MSPAALALMPDLPDEERDPVQPILRPRSAFVELTLQIPAACWRLCGREPPRAPSPRRRRATPAWARDLADKPISEVRALVPARPPRSVLVDPRELPIDFTQRVRGWKHRHQRMERVPSKTIRPRPLSPVEQAAKRSRQHVPKRLRVIQPIKDGACTNTVRPCPFWSCDMHLGKDVTDSGSLKINYPNREPWQLWDSCALDLARQGRQTFDRIGEAMNLSNQRVEQMVSDALEEFAVKLDAFGLPWPEEVFGPRPDTEDE